MNLVDKSEAVLIILWQSQGTGSQTLYRVLTLLAVSDFWESPTERLPS
jgi:hypothetical protein